MRSIFGWTGCAALVLAAGLAAAGQAVDVNSASQEDLGALEGMSPELAANLVREREENGPYRSVDDLKRVPGMTPAVLDQIRSAVAVKGITAPLKQAKAASGGGDDEVAKILKRFDHEPTVQQVQEEALSYARAHPGLIDSWRIRARMRGAAPEVRVVATYTPSRDVQWLRSQTSDPLDDYIPPPASPTSPRRDTLDQRATLGAQATWRLGRLIFDEEEPRVNREAVRLSKHMDQVLDDVTRRYFERRRLQVEMEMNPPADINDRVRKEIRLQELTADLDGMTGGYFSQKIKQKGGRR